MTALENRRSLARRCASQSGTALAVVLHVLLLACVLGQIVYLASRHRVRVDLTEDRMWTSTESTRQLLDRLDKRLVIEAYFSPKETLPVNVRALRDWADNFLDEVVQIGRGKVVLQRFDPNSDKAIADRATRLGIQPLKLQSQSTTSLSVDQHWLGLRLQYGGDKQKVLPQFAPTSSFVAEAVLTPAIKEVTSGARKRIGFMEWPAMAVGAQTPSGIGFQLVRTHEGIGKRYDFQNLKDEDGALLPDDVDTLFLFRPRDLTDRQKYVIDQFVVRGGTLVVFADAAEYAIGQQRTLHRIPFQIDASGSQLRFVDQLASYGIDWRPKVLADMAPQAHTPRDRFRAADEYLAVMQQTAFGPRAATVAYPYFFHAVNFDWAKAADELARIDGKVDEDLARRYRDVFVPGMPTEDFLFAAFRRFGRGPSFYWPTWTGLVQKAGGVADLPDDVTGRVLLWSSPMALVEDPPIQLDPIGRDPLRVQQSHRDFSQKLLERFRAEPRLQAPLMVEVKGRLRSFFAGKEKPKRPSQLKAEREAEAADPKADGAESADEPTAAVPPVNPDEGPQPAPKTEPAVAVDSEPAMRLGGDAAARIVMVGDATFLRDDLVRGDHRQAGGPVSSATALIFFSSLLDWLSEDRDLVALQSRSATDRSLTLLDETPQPNDDPRSREQSLRQRTTALVAANVLVPSALLVLFGLVVLLVRRGQKRAFLASVGAGS